MANTGTFSADSSSSVLPTVGGVEIASHVRLAVGDNNANDYEFSNSDLLTLFDYAIRQYQEYHQYTLTQSFTTVADQKDYALPSSCLRVLSHTYRALAGISSDTFVAYYNAVSGYPLFVPYNNYTDVTMNRVRQEFYRRIDELGAGQGEVINYLTSYAATKYIRIFPTPTVAGETFTVTFTANHPIQSNDYFTIPAEDAVHVRKLLQAQVLEVRLVKMASTANEFASGTTKTKFERSMNALEHQIADLRQQVHDALTSPQIKHG